MLVQLGNVISLEENRGSSDLSNYNSTYQLSKIYTKEM